MTHAEVSLRPRAKREAGSDPGAGETASGLRRRFAPRNDGRDLGSSQRERRRKNRGCSSMVEQQPSKLNTRVRFPSPAPIAISTVRIFRHTRFPHSSPFRRVLHFWVKSLAGRLEVNMPSVLFHPLPAMAFTESFGNVVRHTWIPFSQVGEIPRLASRKTNICGVVPVRRRP